MHEAHRLHLALDRFGHKLFDFERRGARVGADQRRTLDDEYRQQDEKEKPNDFSVLQ